MRAALALFRGHSWHSKVKAPGCITGSGTIMAGQIYFPWQIHAGNDAVKVKHDCMARKGAFGGWRWQWQGATRHRQGTR